MDAEACGFGVSEELRFLERSPVHHADMIDAIRSGGAQILRAEEHGALLSFGGVVMMTADNTEAADRLLSSLPSRTDLLEIHQEFYRGEAERKTDLRCKMECRQAVWTRKTPLPRVNGPAEIHSLSEEALPFVAEYYKHADDLGYLRQRLQSGCLWGAFLGKKPAGFIGLHEEGSMGMLEVLPEYQRRGIAMQLETFLANRQLAAGRIPFAQIETCNGASFALHGKLGFEVSEEKLYWLMPG